MATRFWKIADHLALLIPSNLDPTQEASFPSVVTYCSTEEALNLDPWTERDEAMGMIPMGPAQAAAAKDIQHRSHAEIVGSTPVLGYAKWISAGSLASSVTPLLIKECSEHTGSRVWEGALLHLQWAFENLQLLAGKSVLELGAGCGLLGLALAKAGGIHEIVISDFQGHYVDESTPSLMELLMENTTANLSSISAAKVSIWELDWAKPAEAKHVWPPAADGEPTQRANFDVVLGSELIYSVEGATLLLNILPSFIVSGGACYLLNNANRTGVAEFITGCTGAQLICEQVPFDKLAADRFIYTMGQTTFDNTYVLFKITRSTQASECNTAVSP